MPIKPPLIDLPIRVSQSGFYQGFTKDVAITAKILVGALILWAIAFPDQAASVLGQMNSFILAVAGFTSQVQHSCFRGKPRRAF